MKSKRKQNDSTFLKFLLILGIVAAFFLFFRDYVPPGTHPEVSHRQGQADQPEAETALPKSPLALASFNIRVFSDKSRSDEELLWIAKLISRYDLIAIQEVRDTNVLDRTIKLLNEMGLDYTYEVSPPVGRLSPERFAFIYKKGKVEIVEKGKLYSDPDDQFIRNPFYASFRSGNFDFTLIDVHILWGKSKSHRRPELASLALVYKQIQDEDPHEQDVILLGDFNMPPDDFSFAQLKALPSMTWLIRPPEKTMITDSNLYDNFWFEKDYLKEYSSISGINKYDETMFHNDDVQAKAAVSDHRLIWAVFQTDLKDDD